MDLLATFFFSSVIITSLRMAAKEEHAETTKGLAKIALKAGLIGTTLLGIVYWGFCYVAAAWADHLSMTSPQYFLGALAVEILGPYAGIVACVAVAMACLTTVIALAVVSTEFLHYDIFKGRISYVLSLVITLIANYFVSILDFTAIMEFLAPILVTCYPALILLSFLNLAYKLWNFQSVKIPTACVFILSLWSSLS
jgi:LIVCS family branched-chain amino acid:cation transporter